MEIRNQVTSNYLQQLNPFHIRNLLYLECLYCKPDKKKLEDNCYNKENGTAFVQWQTLTQPVHKTYPLAVVADIKSPKNPLNRRCPICENTASAF